MDSGEIFEQEFVTMAYVPLKRKSVCWWYLSRPYDRKVVLCRGLGGTCLLAFALLTAASALGQEKQDESGLPDFKQ